MILLCRTMLVKWELVSGHAPPRSLAIRLDLKNPSGLFRVPLVFFAKIKRPGRTPGLGSGLLFFLGCYSAERTTLMDSGGSVPSDSRSM